jgi:hypothetical protein
VYTGFFLQDRVLIKDYQIDEYSLGLSSKPITINPVEYRTAEKWVTSHLRTFRKKVMDAVPLEHFI